MTEHFPIPSPPPELVRRLQDLENLDAIELAYRAGWKERDANSEAEMQKARDGELEAMLAELKALHLPDGYVDMLRAARRPKPLSLKEQALDDFDGLMCELDEAGQYSSWSERIRQALEQLPN